MNNKAIVLVDHGSRNPRAHVQFESLYVDLKEKSLGVSLFFAHMEIADPLLEDVLREISSSYEIIEVLPLFLFAGKHIQKDIPEIINRVSEIHQEVEIKLSKPLGLDSEFSQY